MKGLAFSATVLTLLKGIFKVINILLTIIARIMILFGLWVPFFYLLISIILMLAYNINVLETSYNYLYLAGLILCIAISVIITVRNMVIKPIKELIDYRRVQIEYDKRREQSRMKRLYERNPKKYYAMYGKLPDEESEYYKKKRSNITKIDELPKIYRSSVNEEIIIHEFKDKYEVFLDKGNEIVHIDTKSK